MLVAIDEFVWPPLNIFTLRTRDIGKLKESMAINVFLFAFHQLLFLEIDIYFLRDSDQIERYEKIFRICVLYILFYQFQVFVY